MNESTNHPEPLGKALDRIRSFRVERQYLTERSYREVVLSLVRAHI